ncbi:unnamed protein product [Ostreobium quekettii]|uniref:Uncharacterized protein n=1 Tax=Ostreobium quekettii TaxID=121088 RepID=A0A8S1J478_9CHLO|nr:unnamed protein product [Ostreobium quekettii]
MQWEARHRAASWAASARRPTPTRRPGAWPAARAGRSIASRSGPQRGQSQPRGLRWGKAAAVFCVDAGSTASSRDRPVSDATVQGDFGAILSPKAHLGLKPPHGCQRVPRTPLPCPLRSSPSPRPRGLARRLRCARGASAGARLAQRRAEDSPATGPVSQGSCSCTPASACAGPPAVSDASSSTTIFNAPGPGPTTFMPGNSQMGCVEVQAMETSMQGSESVRAVQTGSLDSHFTGDLQRKLSLPDLRALACGWPVSDWQQGNQRASGNPHTPYYSSEGAYLF